MRHPSITYPHITPIKNNSPPIERVYSFEFDQSNESIRVSINASVYNGAKRAEKNATVYGNFSEEEWIPGYYQAFVSDYHQDSFYEQCLAEFKKIRDVDKLDDDQYLEMISVFVQSIPYAGTGEGGQPKFPIETFVNQTGDCDDKSLLLAALLSREDFNVSLLYFEPEEHMAVGVSSDACSYKDTGYAFIETTKVSYIGIAEGNYSGGITLTSPPRLIKIGTGTRSYGSCNETMAIWRTMKAADDNIAVLDRELKALRIEMDGLLKARRIREYNQVVLEYNAHLHDYNSNVTIHNYIMNHQFDRTGVYDWISNKNQ